MKNSGIVLVLVLVMGLTIGACGEGAQKSAAKDSKIDISEVTKQASQAIQTATKYASQEMEEAAKQFQAGMDAFENEMADLERKASQKMAHLSDAGKDKWRQAQVVVEEKKKNLEVQLAKLKDKSRDELAQARQNLEKARQELKEAMQHAKQALQ